MRDENLPANANNVDVSDLTGLGKVASALVGPIMHGVGKIFAPLQSRRENRAQIDNFNAWEEALAAKNLSVKRAELTIAERAEVRVLAEAIIKQVNRENVALAAIDFAEHDSIPQDTGVPPPDHDWLDRFWNVAENVSNVDMQVFFGMVLSRRATSQAQASARAVEFLALLSSDEAKALERIASLRVTIETARGTVSGVMQGLNGLDSHGATPTAKAKNAELVMHVQPLHQDLFGSLGIFIESGWAHGFYYWKSGAGSFQFKVANRTFSVQVKKEHLNDEGSFTLASGVVLSPLGQEIFSIINPPADEAYIQLLREGLELRGIILEEVAISKE